MVLRKEDMVRGYMKKTGCNFDQANYLYKTVIEYISDLLKSGNTLDIFGLMKIGIRYKKNTKKYNFHTKEMDSVPAKYVPYCEFSKAFRRDVSDFLGKKA